MDGFLPPVNPRQPYRLAGGQPLSALIVRVYQPLASAASGT